MQPQQQSVLMTIAPDNGPDAIPTVHVFQCATPVEDRRPCGWVTLPSLEFEDAREGAFDHLATHPEHHLYQHVVSQPWRMTLRGGPAAASALAHSTCTPTQPKETPDVRP